MSTPEQHPTLDPPLGRVLTALATPFDAEGSLDLDGAQRLAAHCVEHGSDGLVVCGTTGESPTLTHEETLAMFRAVVEAVDGRATVVAGTGKNATAETVALTREAATTGVDGVLAVTPYYNRPSQRGLTAHFEAVAAAAGGLPVILYNIPGRTAREIAVDTLVDLAERVEAIAGVKDAVGDLGKTSWVAARTPEDFVIYAGDDAATLPMLAVGGAGVISVSAHLAGRDFAEMVAAFPTDPARARALHQRLLPLISALMTTDPSPAPLKAALRRLGLPAGPVRAPLVDVDEATLAVIEHALVGYGLLEPSS
ncbi:MAG: 4-hydroxy-tetrahydrodipicolinate synthase [Actinomycetota bacterium]